MQIRAEEVDRQTKMVMGAIEDFVDRREVLVDKAVTLATSRQQNTTPQTIYCDAGRSGSYTEDGTKAYPYKTLTAALTAKVTDAATTSYVFYLAPGEYTGVFSLTKTTANQSISIIK